ncbi:hypothetical protein ABT366_38550, partial [Streptomyces lydicus]
FVTVLDVRRLAGSGLVRLRRAPGGLPRRRPGASLDGSAPPAAAEPRPPTWQLPVPDVLHTADPDIALLVRLRTALEENL